MGHCLHYFPANGDRKNPISDLVGYLLPGCRTVSNNGSGSGLAPAQNILAVQIWFGFT